jgi:hypothetical protein
MMKKLVSLLVFFNVISFCQQSYFPLEVGNYWQYEVKDDYNPNTIYFYKFTSVIKDTMLLGLSNTYYVVRVAFNWNLFYEEDTLRFLRYDSLLNLIVEYDSKRGEESILFKLGSVENECWDYFGTFCCFSIDSSLVFDYMKPSKIFGNGDGPPFWACTLAKDFGPIKMRDDQSWGFPRLTIYNLVYARIGGVEYGQLVSVYDEHPELSTNFYLFQNYPNPFNPSTQIRYSIPKTTLVTINVYDILGKEVATLVNEEKSPGNYEVEFNGSSLPSGIYFYKLQAGDFVEAKKMVLMK